MAKTAVETIADRDVHQTIFAAQWHRGLSALLRSWKKAGAGAAAHDYGKSFVLEGYHINLSPLIGLYCQTRKIKLLQFACIICATDWKSECNSWRYADQCNPKFRAAEPRAIAIIRHCDIWRPPCSSVLVTRGAGRAPDGYSHAPVTRNAGLVRPPTAIYRFQPRAQASLQIRGVMLHNPQTMMWFTESFRPPSSLNDGSQDAN